MTIIGHNGAGKSTLISYLLNFYTNLKQHPFLEHFSQHVKPLSGLKIGYAPEAAFLDLNLCAKDYFLLMSAMQKVELPNINEALEQVSLDIDINAAIKTYSKGMKQRLLLALALLGNPDMVILDEPTSGLDPFGQEAIESLLISLREKYRFIICTHSLHLAHAMQDEIWILKEGEIVFKEFIESLKSLEKEFALHQPKALR